MLTPDCYESHVPRWDGEGVGEGVTHLTADIKISYYWIKNAWLLHTMRTGRSCHYAGTRSSAQRSQKQPENKQYSILPSRGRALREGITYGINNHRGEMPEMLWNVVTNKEKNPFLYIYWSLLESQYFPGIRWIIYWRGSTRLKSGFLIAWRCFSAMVMSWERGTGLRAIP